MEDKAPRREITAEEQSEINGTHKYGVSVHVIAEKLGHSKSTAQDTIKRFKDAGSPHPDVHPGQPEMLSDRDKRALN